MTVSGASIIYAEYSLTKHRVADWIYEDRLTIEYQQTLLARYRCQIDRQRQSLKSVSHPLLYRPPLASPRIQLFQLDDEHWLKVLQRLPCTRRKLAGPMASQLPLLGLEFALWLFLIGR